MLWRRLFDRCGIWVLFGGLAFTMSAVAPSAALADACFVTPAKLSDEAVESLTANLDALLEANPAGGYQLTTQIRSIAGSDSDAIEKLVELAKDANPEQIAAIAAGLAQAATACVLTRPDVTQLIQELVAASGNEALIAAFAASSGDTQTAAFGGTGGAGGGGAGGVGGPGGGPSSPSTNSPTVTFSQDGETFFTTRGTSRGFINNDNGGPSGGCCGGVVVLIVSPTT